MKILIVFNNFQLGGVGSAMVNLLREISTQYDIDLFCFSQDGPLKILIPSNVKILRSNKWVAMLGDSQKLTMKKSKALGFVRLIFVVYSKIFGSTAIKKLLFKHCGEMRGYDVAISFSHDLNHHIFSGGGNRYVAEFTDARKKITFVHCDFSMYGGNTQIEREYYHKFNKIACCSKGCKRVFDACIPSLSNRTCVVYNCLDYQTILKKKDEFIPCYDSSNFNIVSVCRLSYEKGIDRALKVFSDIKKDLINVKWYIVGDGPQGQYFKNLCTSLNLDNTVRFLGAKDNPFPFIRFADLFFLPSYHECAPIVFRESIFLGTPIFSTNTISVDEMIVEPQVGIICENNSDGIRDGLRKILKNKDCLNIYNNIEKNEMSNSEARKQFRELVAFN